jgi:hypothetical protein
MGLPSIPDPNPPEGHRWENGSEAVMGSIIIVGLLLAVLAVRYPLINHLAGWLLMFPIVTLSLGSITWSILILRWDAIFSLHGYGGTLLACSVPVGLWVARLNGACI